MLQPALQLRPGGLTDPVIEYGHTAGNCSVTGGYSYRGGAYPWLDGAYFYADYCSGRIWLARQGGSGAWTSTEVRDEAFNIATFGEGADGALYLASYGGSGALYTLTSTVTCPTGAVPVLNAPAAADAGSIYSVTWNSIAGAVDYEVHEATSAGFGSATTSTLSGTAVDVAHTVAANATFHYRVRAVESCGAVLYPSAWSNVGVVAVIDLGAGCDLALTSTTYTSPTSIVSCGTIVAGPAIEVQDGGELELRAATGIILRNGFAVDPGAALAVAVDTGMSPP